jgi:RNA polymerase sigma-70 factor (ECF subfamily)
VDKPIDLAAMFREHELRVFTYFRRMGASRETAADLSQETFLRALRVAHRFRGDSTVATWLLGIARKIYLESMHKQREQPTAEISDVDIAAPGPERVDIERALARLEPQFREVLVLRFALGLPGDEVAKLLGISHDAVRQRVARAKALFQKGWGP